MEKAVAVAAAEVVSEGKVAATDLSCGAESSPPSSPSS